MNVAIEIKPAIGAKDAKIIGLIGAAHFVSHYNALLLPPLFMLVRDDYGVSYTELGLALIALNIAVAALQTPAGLLVDRIGARAVLIAGLVLGAIGAAAAALVSSFPVFIAMFALVGAGNAVFHPADYAILSQAVSTRQAGTAFSIHTFAGILGSAAAPVSLLFLQSLVGWRGAFASATILGLAVAALLAAQRSEILEPVKSSSRQPSARAGETSGSHWSLLLSAPILLNFVFFMALSLTNGALQNYSIVALAALYGVPTGFANAALSSYLMASALGVLVGGVMAHREVRPDVVACLCLLIVSSGALVIGFVALDSRLLLLTMASSGFFVGALLPSRDMIVRAVTPQGAFGAVFGFVTTGFNIAGIAAPLIFGWLLDNGNPQGIFVAAAVCGFIAILTILAGHLRVFRVI
jgi:MFS family permease